MDSKDMQVQVRVPCPACGGRGFDPPVDANLPGLFVCFPCRGTGAKETAWLPLSQLAEMLVSPITATIRRHIGGR